MNSSSRFLLDSNIFIEAYRRYYAFNLCPGFWDSLIWLHEQDKLLSLDRVKDELTGEPDELNNWVKDIFPQSGFADSSDVAVLSRYGELQRWARDQPRFNDAAKEVFALNADAWLIAYASVNKLVLATHEKYKRDVKKRIPIPNVCEVFDVECVNTFEMLTELAIRFEWDNSAIARRASHGGGR